MAAFSGFCFFAQIIFSCNATKYINAHFLIILKFSDDKDAQAWLYTQKTGSSATGFSVSYSGN